MTFSNTGTEVLGELDGRRRPVVDLFLRVAGMPKPVRCHVDTGCDDALVFRDLEFAESLGLTFQRSPRDQRVDRYLANGTLASFVMGKATADWFGLKQITVLAPDPFSDHDLHRGDLPDVLLGVSLLLETELSLQFFGEPGVVKITPRA